MLLSSEVNLDNIVFEPGKVGAKFTGYSRYDVRYKPASGNSTIAMITTNSRDCILESYGIQDEPNMFNKPVVYQQCTLVVNSDDENQCDFHNILLAIAEKFTAYHRDKIGKDLKINLPIKEVDGNARIYCKFIESASGQMYSKFYQSDDTDVSVAELKGGFTARPLVCINFTVKDNINMKVQISEMCIASISPGNKRLLLK